MASVAKTSHAAVLTGVVARARDGAPLNSALLMGPDGAAVSRYDKVNLVPFGEFVPWPFGLLTRKVSTEAGDFEAGKKVVVSSLRRASDRHLHLLRIGVPELHPASSPHPGAEALFNISNDSWFGKSAGALSAPADRAHARGGERPLDSARHR